MASDRVSNEADNKRSAVLFVSDKWLPQSFDHSIPFINRQLAILLANSGITVYSVAIEGTETDIRDAEKHGVELVLPCERFIDRPPQHEWLCCFRDVFTQLQEDRFKNVSVIIGHVGYLNDTTADCMIGIQKELNPNAKLVAFIHSTANNLAKPSMNERQMMDKAIKEYADIVPLVLALGQRVYDDLELLFGSLKTKRNDANFWCYIPHPDEVAGDVAVRDAVLGRSTNVLVVENTHPSDITSWKSADTIVDAMGNVADINKQFKDRRTALTIDINIIKDTDLCLQYLKGKNKCRHLSIAIQQCISLADQMMHFGECSLVVDPDVRKPFSLTSLHCIATGTPVLLNSNCGLAHFVKKEDGFNLLYRNIIVDIGVEEESNDAARAWSKHINEALHDYKLSFTCADKLKDLLEESVTTGKIAQCRRQFLNWCSTQEANGNVEVNPGNPDIPHSTADKDMPNGNHTTGYIRALINLRIDVKDIVLAEGYLSEDILERVKREIALIKCLPELVAYIEKHGHIQCLPIEPNSLIMPLVCKQVSSLERVWKQMWSGQLNNIVQKEIVTKQFLHSVDATDVTLTTNILTWEYNICRAELTCIIDDTENLECDDAGTSKLLPKTEDLVVTRDDTTQFSTRDDSESATSQQFVKRQEIIGIEIDSSNTSVILKVLQQCGSVSSDLWGEKRNNVVAGLIIMENCDENRLVSLISQKPEMLNLLGVQKILLIDSHHKTHLRLDEGIMSYHDDMALHGLLSSQGSDILRMIAELKTKKKKVPTATLR